MISQFHADALLKAAPTFFSENGRSPFGEWGFEVDDGWFDLLFKAVSAIEKVLVDQPRKKIRCAQIKEKFGGLRIYYDGPEDKIVDDLIEKAEKEAAKTCEVCGHVNGAHWPPSKRRAQT